MNEQSYIKIIGIIRHWISLLLDFVEVKITRTEHWPAWGTLVTWEMYCPITVNSQKSINPSFPLSNASNKDSRWEILILSSPRMSSKAFFNSARLRWPIVWCDVWKYRMIFWIGQCVHRDLLFSLPCGSSVSYFSNTSRVNLFTMVQYLGMKLVYFQN